MKIKPFAFAVAALLATPALAATTAADYVAKAGAGDMYEIRSSKLVVQSTKNAGLRRFANMMVMDHNKSTADVKMAAKSSGLMPKPPMMDAKQQGMIRALTMAKGPARDQLYVEQQKAAHQEALMLHQDYASAGDKPALQAVAGKIVPVVQHHIDDLSKMPM